MSPEKICVHKCSAPASLLRKSIKNVVSRSSSLNGKKSLPDSADAPDVFGTVWQMGITADSQRDAFHRGFSGRVRAGFACTNDKDCFHEAINQGLNTIGSVAAPEDNLCGVVGCLHRREGSVHSLLTENLTGGRREDDVEVRERSSALLCGPPPGPYRAFSCHPNQGSSLRREGRCSAYSPDSYAAPQRGCRRRTSRARHLPGQSTPLLRR